MALNDSCNWDTDTPQDHKDAFMKSFGVHRILIPAGTEFYKLTQYPLVNPKDGRITPWWNYYPGRQVPHQPEARAKGRPSLALQAGEELACRGNT